MVGDFWQRILGAGEGDETRTDAERAARGEASGAGLAGTAGEDQGVAVGVFVILSRLLEK